MSNDLKGIYSALLVSFHEDGRVNEQGTRQIIRHNIDRMKVDGLYIGGSTGENFMLSTDEKKQIFKLAAEENNKKVKLIAQVGSLNLYESIELAKYATQLGYDAISAVTPFYYKFSFAEIKKYYNTILEHVDNRMIVYSIPVLTGVNMDIAQFAELFENKKIVGVKFTAGDFFLLERMRNAFPDKLIFAGFDEMMLPAASIGIDGAIGSTFNVNGVRARAIMDHVAKGDLAAARKEQQITNDLIQDILSNGLYPTLKTLLSLQGVDAGYNRQPMESANAKQREMAEQIYRKYFAG